MCFEAHLPNVHEGFPLHSSFSLFRVQSRSFLMCFEVHLPNVHEGFPLHSSISPFRMQRGSFFAQSSKRRVAREGLRPFFSGSRSFPVLGRVRIFNGYIMSIDIGCQCRRGLTTPHLSAFEPSRSQERTLVRHDMTQRSALGTRCIFRCICSGPKSSCGTK